MAIVNSGNLGLRGTGLGADRSLKDEFEGTDDFSDYVRGGAYVPDGPPANASISKTAAGLEMSQFYGSINALTCTIVAGHWLPSFNCGYFAASYAGSGYGSINPDPFDINGSNAEYVGSVASAYYDEGPPPDVWMRLSIRGQGKTMWYFTSFQIHGVFGGEASARTQGPFLATAAAVADDPINDSTQYTWLVGGETDTCMVGNSYDITIIP